MTALAPDITAVSVVCHGILRLTFADGLSGEIHVLDRMRGPVFDNARTPEARFVASCLETIRDGTQFVDLEKIALVLTEDSKNVRLLQLADLIVGCTVAYVGGESDHSPALFDQHIKPMLRSEQGRIGGVGLKLHADLRYANLYHWLLGDSHWWKGNVGSPLPVEGYPYVSSADDPSTSSG
jgi:hypothetical protein